MKVRIIEVIKNPSWIPSLDFLEVKRTHTFLFIFRNKFVQCSFPIIVPLWCSSGKCSPVKGQRYSYEISSLQIHRCDCNLRPIPRQERYSGVIELLKALNSSLRLDWEEMDSGQSGWVGTSPCYLLDISTTLDMEGVFIRQQFWGPIQSFHQHNVRLTSDILLSRTRNFYHSTNFYSHVSEHSSFLANCSTFENSKKSRALDSPNNILNYCFYLYS